MKGDQLGHNWSPFNKALLFYPNLSNWYWL